MKMFRLTPWPRYIFEPNGLEKHLGREAATIGKKALLVIGQGSVRKYGYLDRAVSSLRENGVEFVLFEGVEPNPKHTTANRGGQLAREEGCDHVIALGGGSVMDAAKGMAVVAATGDDVWDYAYHGPGSKLATKALPLIAVPTTAATGSEVNTGAVITNLDVKEKVAIVGPAIMPTVTIWDPSLTLSIPPRLTALGGVDILCHTIEPFIASGNEFEPSDGIAASIIRTVMQVVPKVMEKPNDIELRSWLAWASSLGISMFHRAGRSGSLAMHWFEHVLSAHYDNIAHAEGLAALLPSWLRMAVNYTPQRFEKLFFYLNGRKGSAEELIGQVEKWLQDIGLRLRLRYLGVDRNSLELLAEDVVKVYSWGVKEAVGGHTLSREEVLSVFEDAF